MDKSYWMNGDKLAMADTQNFVNALEHNGWTRIPRKVYRQKIREKSDAGACDHRAQGESANEVRE